ncbi:MAG: response regulator [bacterium]
MTKVLIADDHPLFRHGLKQLLQSTGADWHVDEAGQAQEILDCVWRESYDLVFLDISLPGRNGLEVLEEILRRKPDMPVLMLSMHSEDQFASQSLSLGASGYISKDTEPHQILEAVNAVLRGEAYFHTKIIKKLTSRWKEGGREVPPHERLSPRELEVMRMLVKGQRLAQIAQSLSISKSAVSTYRLRMLEKMNMKNNSELVQYAVRAGLLE